MIEYGIVLVATNMLCEQVCYELSRNHRESLLKINQREISHLYETNLLMN